MRRDLPYSNGTISQLDVTSLTTTESTSPTSTSAVSTGASSSIDPTASSAVPLSTTPSPSILPPPIPPSLFGPSNPSDTILSSTTWSSTVPTVTSSTTPFTDTVTSASGPPNVPSQVLPPDYDPGHTYDPASFSSVLSPSAISPPLPPVDVDSGDSGSTFSSYVPTIAAPSTDFGPRITPPPLPSSHCDSHDPDCSPSSLSISIPFISAPTFSDSSITTNLSEFTISSRPPLKTPPRLPSFTGIFTNYSTSVDLNATTPSTTCTGSVTYYGSVPPTVYVTVTEGFDVTVTASNVSVTDTPTLVTPLPACSATIMPLDQSFVPLMSTVPSTNTNPKVPLVATASSPFNAPPLPPNATPAIAPAPPDSPFGAPAPAASSEVYSSVDYTSTVVVTKKTPVTVVVPPTTSLDINFNFPSQTPTPSPNSGGGINDGSGGNNGGSNNNNNNNGESSGGSDNDQPGNEGSNGNTGGGSGASNGGSGNTASSLPDVFASIKSQGSTGGSHFVNTGTPTTLGLGNIIASIINSPFVAPSPATRAPVPAAAPLTTSVGGVPVVVLPSNSVAIGSQTFAIPNLASTTVQVSGVVFTLQPSQIVAPSATITFVQPQREQLLTPVATGTITTTVGDLTLTVGPTAAIISGTTYRIGSGAPATTVVVDGTRISVGAGGVGLPSTTVAPGGVTGTPFVVYTTEGLTFSVGSTVAIVGGTTYRIGSNAPEVTATLGADHVTVSFGPLGVGLTSTTLAPGGSPFVVVTAEGLTFSIDGTEAVISGTTYRIGSNAPQVTTSLGSGHASVSFGPGGVGLKSTTIHPTTAVSHSTQTAKTGSKATSPTTSATQSAALGSGASTQARVSVSGLFGWPLLAMLLLLLVI
ncbi:hypothetical protein G647_07385 [Cladophialophora carrionii CBS 160.54]|uniref:Uncharacterized protein n=1 Tax=Cladophialophora carrionii CBS 160.54 TaxID=1279043 RepID=V9D4W1_9EURO|nr:uncharacterized protein G647_07385 [Cladophialophora carrionii CBS 160.54]ETI21042.1 hypothetical protein G647_07385 [Cladophialophora carrionii CBS 160.54]